MLTINDATYHRCDGLSRRDWLRVGSLGLRSRRVRALLSALGISIGIAAIVGVLGISQSSKSGLLNELGRLGNLLTVQPGNTAFGQQTELPATAEGMVSRVGPVTNVTGLGSISNTYVYRSSFVPAVNTNGISLTATDTAFPTTFGAGLAHGRSGQLTGGPRSSGKVGANDFRKFVGHGRVQARLQPLARLGVGVGCRNAARARLSQYLARRHQIRARVLEREPRRVDAFQFAQLKHQGDIFAEPLTYLGNLIRYQGMRGDDQLRLYLLDEHP